MCRGSLDTHLLRENDTELNWSRRIKIAIGIARAVDYLHSCARPVIHRDLKASNVLLDAEFNPELSDFGLARYGPLEDQSHVSSGVIGTRGYIAPEYFTTGICFSLSFCAVETLVYRFGTPHHGLNFLNNFTGHLTVKTDVYSFGVVLLELFSGCVAVKRSRDTSERDLAVWAKPHLSSHMELRKIIDKKIVWNIDMDEAQKFASIICRCLSSDPKNRPTMGEVLASLEQLEQDMLLSNLNTLGLSKYYRRAHI
ncbi:probable serine/threonine-protein kinase PBL9 isoform X1 [Hibiscus syriacus]|uniref:probable serine/threonine-protein kinase PBL9 isoform X1 n=1 Tax=Hibiscus syriacus TaxID=106335 RepID=UPI001923D575|nr:probable serine/threonine-protein kinase PBL9 isoform X1 [Hibiscus syriacus]